MNVRVPALRERIDDLPLLVRGFLATLRRRRDATCSRPRSSPSWRGTTGRATCASCEITSNGRWSFRSRSPRAARGVGSPTPGVDARVPFKIAKDAAVDAFERAYVSALLDDAAGNVSRAARNAGMDRMYLHRLIQKHALRTGPRDRDPD